MSFNPRLLQTAWRQASDAAPWAISATAPDSSLVTSALPRPGITHAARPMPVCGSKRRVNCVVDGDTIWLEGEKIRIENIDAPEVKGRCPRETGLAARSTRRLSGLLTARDMTIARNGHDRYGRTLATVGTPQGDTGGMLMREGLAKSWQGHKAEWCGA